MMPARAGDLDRIPAARLRQQRVHRHDQRVAHAPVVIVTFTGAWFRLPAALGSVSDASTVIVAQDEPLPVPLAVPGRARRRGRR